MRLVEGKDLARGIRTVAKAVPDFAFRVLVAAEEHLPRVAGFGPGHENDDRFGLGKAREIVGMTVRPVRIMRVRVADRLRRRRDRGDPSAALRPHGVDQARTPVAVMLMAMVHGI